MCSSFLSRRGMALGCASLLLGLWLCAALPYGAAQLSVGAAVCADTLRLHIRADSDALPDQTLKLLVRDAVLALADASCPQGGKPAARAWAAQNLGRIQLTAKSTLARYGAAPAAQVQLVNMFFGTSHYAGASLPAGRYDAVRIDLGENARHGKNWWCVLYPGLCRTACGGYDLPQENDLVCGEYILRFRLSDWWQRRTAPRADVVLLKLPAA